MRIGVTFGTLLLTLLCLPSGNNAADNRTPVDLVEGYLQYKDDPLWHKGGKRYVRSSKTTPAQLVWSGRYGCYTQVPASITYEFTEVPDDEPTVAVVPILKPPPFRPGWKEQVLDVARQRDEYSTYLAAINALGYKGQFYDPGLATSFNLPFKVGLLPPPPLLPDIKGSSYSLNLGTYGVQGATQYGYSYNSLREMYGTTDLNALYQQAARLAQGSQQLTGQATGDFSKLVGQAGADAVRVAEILAKGQAARQALEAANAAPSQRLQVQGLGTTVPGFQGGYELVPAPRQFQYGQAAGEFEMPSSPEQFLLRVGIPLCSSCHGNGNTKGNFDIRQYPNLPLEQKVIVWSRLLNPDPAKRMPQSQSGGPGQPITHAQFRAFVNF